VAAERPSEPVEAGGRDAGGHPGTGDVDTQDITAGYSGPSRAGAVPPRARGLVLASASPRRRELLERAGLSLEVRPADVDETPRSGEDPLAYVARLSVDKVHRQRSDGDITVAADTAVIVDGDILGKAEDATSARAMLQRLSGRAHTVATGVAVIGTDGRLRSTTVTTRVWMAPLSSERIDWYIATAEPFGKAGGYAVQGRGAAFVRSLEGSWTNVVGLPLVETLDLLTEAGLTLPS
jgi:septum formation protein